MMWNAGQHVFNGHYAIERKLGEGGFGITYLAKTPTGDRKVIKTLHDKVLNNPTRYPIERDKLLQNFRKETAILLECRHPNIVRVESFFEEDGLPCLVMEYIEGGTLREQMHRRGALPETEAMQYIQQVGEALTLVHGKKLLHRDINPNNIMQRADTAKAVLIDFGIAREFVRNMTQSHTALATPGYAPLEQYYDKANRGEYTDVYALAATLYALLTGESPVSALDRQGELHEQQPDPLKSLIQVNPNVSVRVSEAVMWGMALDYKQRPQSVRQWLARLRGETNGASLATTTLPPEVSETVDLPTPQPVALLPQAWECVQAITNYSHSVDQVVFSPDGKTLASSKGGWIKLWNLKTGGNLHTLYDSHIMGFSQDGQTLAGKNYFWNVSNGQKIKLVSEKSNLPHVIQVSPDFQTVVGYDRADKKIKLWSAESGKELWTLAELESYRDYKYYLAQFSPDGTILASEDNSSRSKVKLWETATGKELCTIFSNKGSIHGIAFSPNGQILASSWQGHRAFSRFVLLSETRTAKQLCKIDFGHSPDLDFIPCSLSFSPDGEILACGHWGGEVSLWQLSRGWLQSVSAKRIRTFSRDCRGINSIAFSPDGKTLAVNIGYDNYGITLWSVKEGKTSQTFFGHRESVGRIVISPHGQIVAGYPALYLDRTIKLWSTQTGKLIRCLESTERIHHIAFSQHGASLACTGPFSIIVWEISTGKVTQCLRHKLNKEFVERDEFGCTNILAFSPDGEIMAVREEQTKIQLLQTKTVQPIDTLNSHLNSVVEVATFSPDGKLLAVHDNFYERTLIHILNTEAGLFLNSVYDDKATTVIAMVFSPDSNFLAVKSDWRITVWEVSTGRSRCVINLAYRSYYVESLVFIDDGRVLASPDGEETIKFWDAMTGVELHNPCQIDSASSWVEYSRSGNVLVSASEDGTIRVWRPK